MEGTGVWAILMLIDGSSPVTGGEMGGPGWWTINTTAGDWLSTQGRTSEGMTPRVCTLTPEEAR